MPSRRVGREHALCECRAGRDVEPEPAVQCLRQHVRAFQVARRLLGPTDHWLSSASSRTT